MCDQVYMRVCTRILACMMDHFRDLCMRVRVGVMIYDKDFIFGGFRKGVTVEPTDGRTDGQTLL